MNRNNFIQRFRRIIEDAELGISYLEHGRAHSQSRMSLIELVSIHNHMRDTRDRIVGEFIEFIEEQMKTPASHSQITAEQHEQQLTDNSPHLKDPIVQDLMKKDAESK